MFILVSWLAGRPGYGGRDDVEVLREGREDHMELEHGARPAVTQQQRRGAAKCKYMNEFGCEFGSEYDRL